MHLKDIHLKQTRTVREEREERREKREEKEEKREGRERGGREKEREATFNTHK